MKISNRQYKKTSIIMSIHAAVLCALAVTAQAGDKPRIVTDLPKETTTTQVETLPYPNSDPREVILDGPVTKGPLEVRDQPELVPVTMEAWFDHEETDEIWGHTRRYGASITRSELVGLIPQAALIEAARWYLQLDNLEMDHILENRLDEDKDSRPKA